MESANNQSLIRSLTILGSVVIVAFVVLAIWGRDSATVSSTIAPIVTIVTLLVSGMFTLKVSSEAKTAAVEAKHASEANATGIDAVHGIVNSQRTAMEKQIADLRERLDAVHSTLAVERSKPPTVPVMPVNAAAPAAGPTTIAAAGPTTIAPDGPVTIMLPPDVSIVKDGQA